MKTEGSLKSFLVSSLVILSSVLIEVSIFSNITQLPAVPDICLICLLYISLNNGRLMGESMGFVSGLLLDFLSSGPFGLHALCRTIFGYLAGFFCKTLNVDSIFTSVILGICATFIKAVLLFVIALFYPAIKFQVFTWSFLFEVGINAILTPIMFKILGLFKKYIILQPTSAV